MADDPPDFRDELAARRWLEGQPREVSEVIAVRAALRVFPVLVLADDDLGIGLGADLLLPVLRAAASPWLANGLVGQGEAEQARAASDDVAAAARDAAFAFVARDISFAARDTAIAFALSADSATVRNTASASAADTYATSASAFASAFAAEADAASATGTSADAAAVDADAFASGLDRRQVLALPLRPDESDRDQPDVPEGITDLWMELRLHLEDREDEGWQVWIDWYEARLRGDPIDWDLQRAFLQPPETWEAGPKTLNAAIAARLADLTADKPSGERLDVRPATGLVGIEPPVAEDPDAVANAVSQVEDALADFRSSSAGNYAFAINPVVARLDRALSKHRADARRLHDDFARSALNIAKAVKSDPEIDSLPVADLAAACAQGAIDIRIGVKAVSDMEAERRRRRARAPSPNSRSALRRLLDEHGDALEDELREEMVEDVDTLDAAGVPEGDDLNDENAKDADLRLAQRSAWLYKLSRTPPDAIPAIAFRAGRTADEIQKLVDYLRVFEYWADVIALILRSL
ncbi:MAG: hypothetical protein AAF192_01365 [Pseudomonadota bacterium]